MSIFDNDLKQNNDIDHKIYSQYEKKYLNYFAHETCVIDDFVIIGENTRIWHFTHICEGAKIGANCTIGQNCYIGPGVVIGDNCKIQNNVSVYEGVTLSSNVFVGPSVVFTNVKNPRAFLNRRSEFKRTIVQHGASIGANSTIVCGVTLGEYCLIGAGATITKSVSRNALIISQDKFFGYVCECGNKLDLVDHKNNIYHCEYCNQDIKIYQE